LSKAKPKRAPSLTDWAKATPRNTGGMTCGVCKHPKITAEVHALMEYRRAGHPTPGIPQVLRELATRYPKAGLSPHVCPICVGSGCYAPRGTYANLPTRFSHPCHGCSGGGIVWGPPVAAAPSDFGWIEPSPTPPWPFGTQWEPNAQIPLTLCGVPARTDIMAWN
jgi:hypothetical protein